MPATLVLGTDELLTTTRAVRRRLDLDRPVSRETIEECLRIAQQAPSASNLQPWHFVVVDDPERKAALAELWRRGVDVYLTLPIAVPNLRFDDPERQAQQDRIWASVEHLVETIDRVPAMVIPCVAGRLDDAPVVMQSALWGSIAPAAWSFMLAARARGLGTCWTSFHLFFEQEAADLLGIPFGEVTQTALVTLGYATSGDFRPAPRQPLADALHWNGW